MKTEVLLSFCIPTYNRKNQLVELINDILSIDRSNIEVVITDNCSTDNTLSALSRIKDVRLRVCLNQKPLPAFQNMIQAIFNGRGKYIFYCNDREIVYPDKMESFIAFLEDKQLAFIHVKQENGNISNTYHFYRKGYESLLHHRCTHHPSGMVFNGEILRKHLKKEKYFNYLEDHFTYSYLMRDILQYGDSAIYDFGCWNQRPPEFLKKTKSRSNTTKVLYFYPEIANRNIKDVFHQIFMENEYHLSEVQRGNIAIYVGEFFVQNILNYKYCMMSDTETAHYQIEPRYISYKEMSLIMGQYCKLVEWLLKEYGFSKNVKEKWRKAEKRIHFRNLKTSVYIDIRRFIMRKKW